MGISICYVTYINGQQSWHKLLIKIYIIYYSKKLIKIDKKIEKFMESDQKVKRVMKSCEEGNWCRKVGDNVWKIPSSKFFFS